MKKTSANQENLPLDTLSLDFLNNIPNPVIITTPDLSIGWVNAAFEKLTGFSVAEVKGSIAPYPWWPESQHKEYTEELSGVRAGKKHKSDWQFQTKSGSMFWIKAAATPVIQDGKLLYMVASWVDITDNKAQEEILRKKLSRFSVLSQIESNHTVLSQSICSVYELLAEAEPFFKEVVPPHIMQIRIPPGLPDVFINKAYVTQLLVNLMENIVQFSTGDYRIFIEAELNNSGLALSLSGNGPGVTKFSIVLQIAKRV